MIHSSDRIGSNRSKRPASAMEKRPIKCHVLQGATTGIDACESTFSEGRRIDPLLQGPSSKATELWDIDQLIIKFINYKLFTYRNIVILYSYVSLPQGISSLTPRFHQASILPAPQVPGKSNMQVCMLTDPKVCIRAFNCSLEEVSSHPSCRKKI